VPPPLIPDEVAVGRGVQQAVPADRNLAVLGQIHSNAIDMLLFGGGLRLQYVGDLAPFEHPLPGRCLESLHVALHGHWVHAFLFRRQRHAEPTIQLADRPLPLGVGHRCVEPMQHVGVQ